jgi:hypothetical protein
MVVSSGNKSVVSSKQGKSKNIKSSLTTPKTILAIDLVNMEKFEVKGFKYLLNAIDMGSRVVYSQAMKIKTDTEVLKAFKKIYTQSNIRAIRSDWKRIYK